MKKNKRRKKKYSGNDRAIMFLARDIRRRWMQYGETRKKAKGPCTVCGSNSNIEIDHISPVGARFRTWEDMSKYAKTMFTTPCQALCRQHHLEKTKRQKRGK